jgi:manganese oxidase
MDTRRFVALLGVVLILMPVAIGAKTPKEKPAIGAKALTSPTKKSTSANSSKPVSCERIITAEVVALEQAMVLNRYGAFNPSGMLFALKRDVVLNGMGDSRYPDGTSLNAISDDNLHLAAGHVRLRADKRPRPLVLRANEGDCLEVKFHNLLMTGVPDERLDGPEQYNGKVPAHLEDKDGLIYPDNGSTGRELVKATAIGNDLPHTRAAAFHVNGLDVVPVLPKACPLSTANHQWLCGTDGDNVGFNLATVNPATPTALKAKLEQQGGQVYPGQSAIYRMFAFREGTYFAYSTGSTVGGEGDGGQLGSGLFGAVNVQPEGSKWYRSQVTHSDLQAALKTQISSGHPYRSIDYDGARYQSGPQKGTPILAMLDGNEIVHSDLNAVVALNDKAPNQNDTTNPNRSCKDYVFGNSCGQAYREFTVIMHDEVKAVQAFAELDDESNPLHYIKDGMGINYGVGGMGAMVVARNRKTGPTKDCPECRAEEFFLSSWANGDPALVLRWDDAGKKPIGAMYPDDPSNVHHSYLSDPVRFRNIHAGPKETHVFHLHAHQWVMDASEPGSTYLDSQTISPGATFSYEIEYGGSGNRNLTPGDSIFHCHLYPHFAQGMWELWRTHDVFENGDKARNLEDAEVAGGAENPAIVPLPGTVLPPMPTNDFKGYPFYIAGEVGHRQPQPPLDMDEKAPGQYVDGGMPRHVLSSNNSNDPAHKNTTNAAVTTNPVTQKKLVNQDVVEEALRKGGFTAQINAARVYEQNPEALRMLAESWDTLGSVKLLDEKGTKDEKTAMAFHSGKLALPGFTPITKARTSHPEWEQEGKGYLTARVNTVAGQTANVEKPIFWVNGRDQQPGAPFADPCPADAPKREYRASVIQTELTVNRHGWFDPQARILTLEDDAKDIIDPNNRDRLPEPLFFRANSGDCITFKHSNLLPNALALDDFQIYTPTDTVGQHIHLVKFDVTSSDGSGNGWNYEDGTFSPEEVRERVWAYNKAKRLQNTPASELLALKTHPMFKDMNCRLIPDTDEHKREKDRCEAFEKSGTCPENSPTITDHKEWLKIGEEHPFCGAQRTVQRWYADPIFDPKTGKDFTLRTVFTHDHFGPSSHQQHGLYAALIVEPSNSVWLNLAENSLDWNKLCNGSASEKTTERAKVIGGANLAADFDESCNKRAHQVVGMQDLRPPLKLRDDGGPTATRANIIAPACLAGQPNKGSRKNSNPLDQATTTAKTSCPESLATNDTRREYAVAFADFSILYNAALEPINPEQRDISALRFGGRQVPLNQPKPLAISSEDPGTQLINYRNEPVPMRVVDIKPDAEKGGFDYKQASCEGVELGRCTGDMANVFSTAAHKNRDMKYAITNYGAKLSPSYRSLLSKTQFAGKLDDTIANVEKWRTDFNCALYPATELGAGSSCNLKQLEPWRQMGDPATPILPVYEGDRVQVRLIQGAQEAQHVFAMTDTHWLHEPDNKHSGYTNAQPLGISEHFEFNVKVSPTPTPLVDQLYMGSSIDQLWDGMWGIMRTYGKVPTINNPGIATNHPTETGVAQLNNKPGFPKTPPNPANQNKKTLICLPGGTSKAYDFRLNYDIAALRACDLTNTCDKSPKKGVTYNQRLQLDDPNAIVYARINRMPGATGKDESGMVDTNKLLSQDEKSLPAKEKEKVINQKLIKKLQDEISTGVRSLEPLILRASAGACMHVRVHNLLPESLGDGDTNTAETAAKYSDNFMSMIMDGFNYNQLRTSSVIGLSAPMVARFSLKADGANFGLNSMNNHDHQDNENYDNNKNNDNNHLGNLVEAGATSPDYLWYAGKFELEKNGTQKDAAIEFGALPLTSFADVIKHPAHGAIGALVIGPKGSYRCEAEDKRERDADSATDVSATICDAKNKPLYRDFVVVLQDAVDAKINGDAVANLKGAEEPDDYGVKAANYRSEPLWGRRGGDPSIEFEERNEFDYAGVLSSKVQNNDAQLTPFVAKVINPGENKAEAAARESDEILKTKGFAEASKLINCQAGVSLLSQSGRHACDPETPVFVAKAGREIRMRVVHPGGHTRQQAFTVSGHDWNPYPWSENSSNLMSSHKASVDDAWIIQGSYNSVGPMMATNLLMQAGGRYKVPMDYQWRSQASFVYDGGIWGILRVLGEEAK